MTVLVWLTLIAGLTILTAGAESLVRGASKLAAAAGVSPLVIGLTVVAFGTSAPELAVSVKSGWAGQSDIALGNVVGSNICNVLLILGACGLLAPLSVNVQLIRIDVPIMIATALLVPIFGLNGFIGRVEGLILVGLVVSYTVFVIRKSRSEGKAAVSEFAAEYSSPATVGARYTLINVVLVVVGLALLISGAQLFVDAAVDIAHAFGVSELIIGLTIVAVGTSLPEVATSIVATLRGERDIAIGNVVGSNIFNVLAVLGASSVVNPIHISDQAMSFDVPVMIAISIACLPIFFTGMSISRWEGAMFLGYYVAYVAYQVMQSRQSGVPPAFATAMLYFVLPITAITMFVLTWREMQRRRSMKR